MAEWTDCTNTVEHYDSITGLQGEPNQKWYVYGKKTDNLDCIDQTTPIVYIKFWFRHDDYTRAGSAGTGDDLEGKIAYLHHGVDAWSCLPVQGMYLGGQLTGSDDTNSGMLRFRYHNGCVDYDDTWAENASNWGDDGLWLSNANITGGFTDGNWHSLAILHNETDDYFQFWVDDYLMVPDATEESTYRANFADYATGKIYYDSNLPMHLQALQLPFVAEDGSQTCQSTDGDGEAAGFQFDDFEVWNGVPSTTARRQASGSAGQY